MRLGGPHTEGVSDVTLLLEQVGQGDPQAAEELWCRVYEELRGLAVNRMAGEAAGQTLQPTDLVHEVWLRLGGGQQAPWKNRAHFFGAAAEAMRRILVDRARSRLATRHGGRLQRVNVDDLEIAAPAPEDEILSLHAALDRFSAIEPQKAELVKLRYFIGLTTEDAAAALDISVPTAKRWWRYARAWLKVEIGND